MIAMSPSINMTKATAPTTFLETDDCSLDTIETGDFVADCLAYGIREANAARPEHTPPDSHQTFSEQELVERFLIQEVVRHLDGSQTLFVRDSETEEEGVLEYNSETERAGDWFSLSANGLEPGVLPSVQPDPRGRPGATAGSLKATNCNLFCDLQFTSSHRRR